MRYNFLDLLQRNVTKEEIKKMVHSIILKIDRKLFNQEEHEVISALLMDIVEKNFRFYLPQEDNPKMMLEKKIDEINYEGNKKFNEYVFQFCCLKMAIIDREIEEMLRSIEAEKKKKAFLDWLAYKARLKERENLDDWEVYSRLNSFRPTGNEKIDLNNEIRFLLAERAKLVHEIVKYDSQISAAREKHVNHIFSHANEIMIISEEGKEIPFFANNTEEQILNFILETETRHEILLRSLVDLERKRELAMKSLAEDSESKVSGQPIDTLLSIRKRANKINRNFEIDEKKLYEGELYDVRENCIKYNIANINENTPIEEVKEKLKAFYHSIPVERSRSQFAEIVKALHNKIRDCEEKIAEFSKKIAIKEAEEKELLTQSAISKIRSEMWDEKTKRQKVIGTGRKLDAVKSQEVESKETAAKSEKIGMAREEAAVESEKEKEGAEYEEKGLDTAHEKFDAVNTADNDFEDLFSVEITPGTKTVSTLKDPEEIAPHYPSQGLKKLH